MMKGVVLCWLFGALLAACATCTVEGSHSSTAWAVQVREIDIFRVEDIASEHGFVNMGPVGGLRDTFIMVPSTSRSPQSNISEAAAVVWAEAQGWQRREKRMQLPPSDPSYSQQWHLSGTRSIHADGAWEMGITGKRVQVAVVDDGLEWRNKDIMNNYNALGSFDAINSRPDPTPATTDYHGTACGGLVAAVANDVCGVGVAPEAKLAGIRLLTDKGTTDAQEAVALSYRTDVNYVFTNSWGPPDDGKRLEGPKALCRRAMENSIEFGRQGLGTVYVWAGGNGGEVGDNANYDGYANSVYSVTVSAVDFAGKRTTYSERGACLHVCAPSSGATRTDKITTTSLEVDEGCMNRFGGTSAASPQVAGVIALMLQVRPDLSWRDVQGVLVESSDKIDVSSSDWTRNGAGLAFSHDYGYGQANALRAVGIAKLWSKYGARITIDLGEIIPPSDGRDVLAHSSSNFTISVTDSIIVEQVELIFGCSVSRRGDLAVSLFSPTGMESKLTEVHDDDNEDFPRWAMSSVAHWGELSDSEWHLVVSNEGASISYVYSYQLILHGRSQEGDQHPHGKAKSIPFSDSPASSPQGHDQSRDDSSTTLRLGLVAMILTIAVAIIGVVVFGGRKREARQSGEGEQDNNSILAGLTWQIAKIDEEG